MPKSTVAKCLVIGLPESGKSTFIAALWEVVRAFVIPGAMHFEGLDGDDDYVNQIHTSWVQGEPLERTKVKRSIPVRIKLSNTNPDKELVELVLPDLDGELLKRQWTKREWSTDYEANLQDATGLLLFLSARNVREGTLLDPTHEQLAQLIPTRQAAVELSIPKSEEHALPFDAEKVPTQTMLVELLQFILRWMPESRRMRLAVIISAWDIAEKGNPELKPDDWLKRKPTALLSQFLRANPESFDYRVFGISAQGGELDDPEMKTRLKREPYPANRIKVVDNEYVGHDVTLPIQWLMERSN